MAVAVTLVWPWALVTAGVVSVALAPEDGALNTTVTPLTGLLLASFTVTCSAVPKAVLVLVDCGVPPVAVIDAGGGGVFVSANVADGDTPATLAVTLYGPPATPLAVAVTLVCPWALVTAGVVSVALAPVAGAENVTVTPLTGLLPASFTVTCSATPKAVLIRVDCGVPAVAAIDAAGP